MMTGTKILLFILLLAFTDIIEAQIELMFPQLGMLNILLRGFNGGLSSLSQTNSTGQVELFNGWKGIFPGGVLGLN